MKVLIVDNVDSFVYNLYQYVGELGGEPEVVPNTITVDEVLARAPDRIILSPGPGRPEDAGACVRIIQQLGPRIPIMGVCLGHQAIGIAFGGIVSRAFSPLHGKASRIRHDGRGLYAGIRDSIVAARYHSLTVKKDGLPACLMVTAQSDDGEIMGLRHREFPIEGVQFHPESILTDYGRVLLKNFLYRGV